METKKIFLLRGMNDKNLLTKLVINQIIQSSCTSQIQFSSNQNKKAKTHQITYTLNHMHETS